MKVVIRADASVQIGTGHIMRCLTVAHELQTSTDEILFICRTMPGHLCDYVERHGFKVLRLPASPDGGNEAYQAGWERDASDTRAALDQARLRPDCLIVDHYALDAGWERAMRASAHRLMVIDDLADRLHDCDILLDQNLFPNMEVRYEGLIAPQCASLLGPHYALLRPEYRLVRDQLRKRCGKVNRILVFFGGSDPTNETVKALRAIGSLDAADLRVDVVVGASNPRRNEVKSLCATMPFVSYHCQIESMADLMAAADLAVGAGGTAAWERCCVGLPALVISVATNQDGVAHSLANAGAICFLGRSDAVSESLLRDTLQALLDDVVAVRTMSDCALSLTDGQGATRVVSVIRDTLSQGSIHFRPASLGDERFVYEWRNAPAVRAASFNETVISFDAHCDWFRASLENHDRYLLIAEVGGKPVGILRYDVRDGHAEVGVYLGPGLSGRGLGTQILRFGAHWLKDVHPSVKGIKARIRPENHGSRKAFLKAGYVERGDHYFKKLD